MKYDIVKAKTVDDLISRVQQKMNEGWMVQGGVTILQNDYQPIILQAIKYIRKK